MKAGRFWRRLGAYLADGIVLFVLFTAAVLFLALGARALGSSDDQLQIWFHQAELLSQKPFIRLVELGLAYLYFAWMESSSLQASLGKALFSLRVTDKEGNRLRFSRALGRNFSKILSIATFGIGFLMVLWSKNQQMLHDYVSDCLVVHSEKPKE